MYLLYMAIIINTTDSPTNGAVLGYGQINNTQHFMVDGFMMGNV